MCGCAQLAIVVIGSRTVNNTSEIDDVVFDIERILHVLHELACRSVGNAGLLKALHVASDKVVGLHLLGAHVDEAAFEIAPPPLDAFCAA